MFPSFRLGTWFGFPVRVNLSFLILLGLVLLAMGGLDGLALVVLVAGSVLLHELGHALMARHLGVRIDSIELYFFGGAAKMAGLPRTPGDEIAIAAAGPAVSFALAGLGHGLAAATGVSALALFGWVNLVLGAFNLVPAFPSDGGRILRALLARRRGIVRATELAVKIGRFVAVALILVGLFSGAYQLALVAVVLWLMGTAERFAVRVRGEQPGWGPARPVAVEYLPPGTAAPLPGSGGAQRWPADNGRPPRRVILVWRL